MPLKGSVHTHSHIYGGIKPADSFGFIRANFFLNLSLRFFCLNHIVMEINRTSFVAPLVRPVNYSQQLGLSFWEETLLFNF